MIYLTFCRISKLLKKVKKFIEVYSKMKKGAQRIKEWCSERLLLLLTEHGRVFYFSLRLHWRSQLFVNERMIIRQATIFFHTVKADLPTFWDIFSTYNACVYHIHMSSCYNFHFFMQRNFFSDWTGLQPASRISLSISSRPFCVHLVTIRTFTLPSSLLRI